MDSLHEEYQHQEEHRKEYESLHCYSQGRIKHLPVSVVQREMKEDRPQPLWQEGPLPVLWPCAESSSALTSFPF